MKKRNAQTTLLVLLVCASIASAVYLNIVSADNAATSNLPVLEMPNQEDFDLDQKSEKPLPDVDILKKVLKLTGKAVQTTLLEN